MCGRAYEAEQKPWVGAAAKTCGVGFKPDSTQRTSRSVPHPSTNRVLFRLTSEVERYLVHSTWYGMVVSVHLMGMRLCCEDHPSIQSASGPLATAEAMRGPSEAANRLRVWLLVPLCRRCFGGRQCCSAMFTSRVQNRLLQARVRGGTGASQTGAMWLPLNISCCNLLFAIRNDVPQREAMMLLKLITQIDLCVSSLRTDHANILCIVPNLNR
jgi:hypothetical protein